MKFNKKSAEIMIVSTAFLVVFIFNISLIYLAKYSEIQSVIYPLRKNLTLEIKDHSSCSDIGENVREFNALNSRISYCSNRDRSYNIDLYDKTENALIIGVWSILKTENKPKNISKALKILVDDPEIRDIKYMILSGSIVRGHTMLPRTFEVNNLKIYKFWIDPTNVSPLKRDHLGHTYLVPNFKLDKEEHLLKLKCNIHQEEECDIVIQTLKEVKPNS